jgi:hypothetical protein
MFRRWYNIDHFVHLQSGAVLQSQVHEKCCHRRYKGEPRPVLAKPDSDDQTPIDLQVVLSVLLVRSTVFALSSDRRCHFSFTSTPCLPKRACLAPSHRIINPRHTYFSPATSAMLSLQQKDWQMRAPSNSGGSPNRRSQQKQATGTQSGHFHDISWCHALRNKTSDYYTLPKQRG